MASCSSCYSLLPAGSRKKCAACRVVYYCNRDCQIAHRPAHKSICEAMAAEQKEAAEAGTASLYIANQKAATAISMALLEIVAGMPPRVRAQFRNLIAADKSAGIIQFTGPARPFDKQELLECVAKLVAGAVMECFTKLRSPPVGGIAFCVMTSKELAETTYRDALGVESSSSGGGGLIDKAGLVELLEREPSVMIQSAVDGNEEYAVTMLARI